MSPKTSNINLFSLNLKDVVRTRFTELSTADPSLYNAYYLCATYIDHFGRVAYNLTPEELVEKCQITGLLDTGHEDMFENVAPPSLEYWRSFLAEATVKKWKEYRLEEAIDATVSKLLYDATVTGGVDSTKINTTIKALQSMKKAANEVSDGVKYIKMYGAPLSGQTPNSIVVDDDGFEDEE